MKRLFYLPQTPIHRYFIYKLFFDIQSFDLQVSVQDYSKKIHLSTALVIPNLDKLIIFTLLLLIFFIYHSFSQIG